MIITLSSQNYVILQIPYFGYFSHSGVALSHLTDKTMLK